MKRGPWLLSVRFNGSVATSIKQVYIYNDQGQTVYNNTNLNSSISKGGYSSQIDMGYIAVANYVVVVLFHSQYGEYARLYQFTFNTATYNTWFSAGQYEYIN